VLITHDPGTAAALASHYVVVADGRVRFAGDPVAFASAPLDRFTARFLGYENLFSRQELEAARAMPIGRSLLDAAGPDGVVVPSSALRWTPARGGAGQVTALRATPGGWLVALHTGPLTFHALVSRPLPGVKVGDAVDLALEEREVRPLHGGSEPP
jgi:ABC-type sulfate/molybdate transport systems ATPase subunit